MSYEYPDDGHIYVCVRVRDVATVPGMSINQSATRRSTRENIKEAQKICVSTMENVVLLHDPKSLDDTSCVARDADNVVQLLTARASGGKSKHLTRKLLTSTATANYFEYDRCLNSMDAESMLQMPLIRNSDFIRPPEYGTQEDVYLCTAVHAVSAAVEGINSCVFAYGQTGSGKTFTLFGDTTCIRRDPGVVPRTVDDLFKRLENIKQEYESNMETEYSYRVQLAFFEIYQNEVYCLFSRKGPLRVNFARDFGGKDETMIIQDLQQHVVGSAEKSYPLIELGLRRRQTGETGMNARSSRSHAVLQIRVTQWRTNRLTKESVELNATINLVDLAGSERQKTAKTDGKSRDEGIQINQSLATLARVINEISRGAKYVNYRDSLLTMVLKDNLGGNSKTFMIATIAPVSFCYQESCATLQYAKDVRKIRNRPTVNKTFQTRSNLLELNAILKQENEQLRHHIDALLRGSNQEMDYNEEMGTVDATGEVPFHHGKFITSKSGDIHRTANTMTETLMTSTTAAAVPIVITAHRKYTSIDGIGGSCVEGGKIGVTSLEKNVTRFNLSDLLSKAQKKKNIQQQQQQQQKCQNDDGHALEEQEEEEREREQEDEGGEQQQQEHQPEQQNEKHQIKTNYGTIEFERVSRRSCEQRYWLRYISPEGTTSNNNNGSDSLGCNVDCQLNGCSLTSGDRRQLVHGDVLCVYLDTADGGAENHLLSFHYVDINCLSRRDITAGDGNGSLSQQNATAAREDSLEQLQRERAKLLDMVQAQSRTIEYQCQRDAASRSRMVSVNNHLIGEKDGSSSPNPVRPYDVIDTHVPVSTPMQASAAARAFYRTSVSPSIRDHSVDSQRYEDCVRENESLYKNMMKRNATFEELARRLAELEKSTSPQGKDTNATTTTTSTTIAALKSALHPLEGDGRSSKSSESSDYEEVSESNSPDGKMSKTRVTPEASMGKDNSDVGVDEDNDDGEKNANHAIAQTATEPVESTTTTTTTTTTAAITTGEQELTADEILLKHRKDPEMEDIGRMHVYLSTSDGVRERYHAAKRERVLCERIWSLEQALEDLRAELHLLESKLRVAQDANLENELRRSQMEDEMTEVSEALLDATEENAALLRDINSLETFLSRTEEALAEASAINEAELERRLRNMSDEIRALKTIARMWKRRAMQRIALEFASDNNNNNNNKDSGDMVHKSGQVPWDDLRVESNAARAKKILGERGCTTAAVNAIDRFEKETAIESVVALETVLAELENENLRLIDDIKTYEEQLQSYKDLLDRLRREKEELEKNTVTDTTTTVEEMEKFKKLYAEKCEELAAAERQYEAAASKLQAAKQKNTAVKKKSVKNNDLLLQEQRRMIEEQREEQEKLSAALISKDEELRTVLRLLHGEGGMCGLELSGFKDDAELRSRIETLLQESMGECSGTGGYSVFPPDFKFSEEAIALIRVCLRVMLDRLKMELYVINRQSLHKFGLLVPAVQLRPEAQFHSFMHELRGVVAEIAGRPQRLGGRWAIEEGDVLARLVDHRRRRAGNALYGLLLWYDHWDLAPKTEHVCYMELIRNSERVMQLARLVRQESLVNTNATSTLRLMIPMKKDAFAEEGGSGGIGKTGADTSVLDSRRILEKLEVGAKRSNLARTVGGSKPNTRISGFHRSYTTASAHSTPRRSGVANVNFSRTATFTGKTPKRDRPTQHQELQRVVGEQETPAAESKFGRRATALVVPVSDNDVTFAATSTLAQHDPNFNFARHMSAVNIPEASGTHSKPAAKVTRFARAKTDVPPSFAALAELHHGKSSQTPTPRRTTMDLSNERSTRRTITRLSTTLKSGVSKGGATPSSQKNK
ncbi:kinesin [Trypanosoma theileri]|uniref:Kinesin n=1 Tax=Trypanosoma theileri TaxID=67003 RepID=A0A1X0NY58_9TRYP|nr:kinesin [Trypanosoma theileri]ORC89488.1 kinesin [Trypanosoma theileri]